MAKGKSTWKYNKLLTGRRNYFGFGDQLSKINIPIPGVSVNPNDIKLEPTLSGTSVTNTGFLGLDWSNPFKGANKNMTNNALTSAIGSAVGSIGNSLIGGELQSGAGSLFQGLGNAAAAIPGPWGAVASAGLGVLGGLTNRMFGSKMNDENIAKVESNINRLNNFTSNASDFDALSQNWANATTGMTFDNDFIGKDGWFSNKAKNKANDLRRQINAGNAWVQNTLNNNADNIGMSQMQNLLGNYAALGGNLMTHGADFDTKLNLIGNGGTHESNPNQGVLMGIDDQGVPNLVEENEVIFNDYVFSNRLKVPKAVRTKYKLRGTKPLTFADAALQMGKESEERPNDPISQLGLRDSMAKLVAEQEKVRMKKEGITSEQFAKGGKMGKLYAGDGTETQVLSTSENTPKIKEPKLAPTWMRYTPAVASGIMSITDAMGITNKPDYSDATAVLDAAKIAGNYTPVRYNPIGNYLTYRPFDRDYYTNKLNAEASAARRGLLNTSSGNRAQAMAGILAADYNAQNSMGDLFRKAEEYNLAQRQKVEDFNRATNINNSDNMLKADLANMEAQLNSGSAYFRGALAASELRQKERLASAASRSANLSNFINSIGDIGRENFQRNMITTDPSKYYSIDSNGRVIYNGAYYNLPSDMQSIVSTAATAASNTQTQSKANGGYLTIKRKKYGKL